MKVLITGASGLIGGRLLKHLASHEDVEVRAVSRVDRSWAGRVESCRVDVELPETLADACAGVDVVVNLSSMGERECAADPQRALRVNAGGVLALAQAASSAGVRRLIHVSTFKVYGNSPVGVITEDTPTKPRSHYAVTHRVAEEYASWQHENAVVFRLANGFGAPADSTHGRWDIIANEMCRAAVTEGRITIRSSGLAWRNFVPMRDIVGAIVYALRGANAGTYNLGASHSMTLRHTAERIADVCETMLHVRPTIVTGPETPGEQNEPLDFRISKLAAAGFTPMASFDEEVAALLFEASRTERAADRV